MTGNGWRGYGQIVSLINDLAEVRYELKNCVRGACTGLTTSEFLAKYIISLANDLIEQAEDFKGVKQIGEN